MRLGSRRDPNTRGKLYLLCNRMDRVIVVDLHDKSQSVTSNKSVKRHEQFVISLNPDRCDVPAAMGTAHGTCPHP